MRFTPGERVVDLLHRASCCQSPRSMAAKPASWSSATTCAFASASSPETKINTLAAGLLRIRVEHGGAKCVAGFHDTCAGDEVGDELARCSLLEVEKLAT